MSIDELEAEVKKLSLRERVALARRIVESLDELSESEIEVLWIEEAERRLDELEHLSLRPPQATIRFRIERDGLGSREGEVTPIEGAMAEYDSEDRRVGLEILDAVRRFGGRETLRQVVLEGIGPSVSV